MKKLFRLFCYCAFALYFSQTNAQDLGGQDTYWYTPQNKTYQERKDIFLDFAIEYGDKDGWLGIFSQIIRAESGEKIEKKYIDESLDIIYSKRDCIDFTANGLLRLLYLNEEDGFLQSKTKKKIDTALIDFKYWWDDDREDPKYRCYHTENHQGLYHTAELLAGQLYKDKVFGDGMNGREHIEHAKERIIRWLDFRFRFGFSEWLSSYYDVDIMTLTNLYDFAEDPEIRKKAGMVLDLLMYDLALNNYHGDLGTTHGRIYASSLVEGKQNLYPVMKLMFGVGKYLKEDYIGTACLVTSSYRCPPVIKSIATDYDSILWNRQRVSINVDDAPKYGLFYDNELDIHLYWGMQEFIHPMVINMSKIMSNKYDTWPYSNYDHYINKYESQIIEHGKIVNPHLDRFALSESNIRTYRTPDYLISTSVDYRPGSPGYQQHIWQATLAGDAHVFTNHPASKSLGVTPNYWAGNARMPRAVQHKNLVICIYNASEENGMPLTHAYFPKDEFDEVVDKGNWVFARKGDGYLALFSYNSTKWKKNAKGEVNDLVAKGSKNVWICEMGSKKEWGNFSKFTKAFSSSVKFQDLNVSFVSPSIGKVKFGWNSPFHIKNEIIPLRNEFRFNNLYSKTPFDAKIIKIKKGKEALILNAETSWHSGGFNPEDESPEKRKKEISSWKE